MKKVPFEPFIQVFLQPKLVLRLGTTSFFKPHLFVALLCFLPFQEAKGMTGKARHPLLLAVLQTRSKKASPRAVLLVQSVAQARPRVALFWGSRGHRHSVLSAHDGGDPVTTRSQFFKIILT